MKPSFLFQLRWMFILTILLAPNLASAGKLHEVKLGKTQFIQRLSKNLVVEVELHRMLINSSYSYKNALLWGGDIDQPPKTITVFLDIKVNNKKLFIPFSAYGDLGDIEAAELEKFSSGFNLMLHGGQTATAYDVVLAFKQGYLYSKKVTHREFPTQAWEKIIYSFVKD